MSSIKVENNACASVLPNPEDNCRRSIMSFQILIFTLLITNALRQSTQVTAFYQVPSVFHMTNCPCQCFIAQNALRKAHDECGADLYEHCSISFCLLHERPGLSCCYEDMVLTFSDELSKGPQEVDSTPDGFELDPYVNPSLYSSPFGERDHNHGTILMTVKPSETATPTPTVTVTPSTSLTPSLSPSSSPSITPTRTPTSSPSPTGTPSVSPTPSPEFATLLYAADNAADVYVNGNLVSALEDWRTYATVSFPFKKNDVVAIHARSNGGWYGLIAALRAEGRWYVTGRDEWKGIKEFEIPGDDELWTLPFFNSCSWLRVEVRPNAHLLFKGKAADFPFQTRSQYVWADDAGSKDGIFVRFVMGGEDCS